MAQVSDRGVRLDGRGYAERLLGRLRERVERVEGSVGIATLLVGDDEASAIYQRRIDRGAHLLGIASRPERLPADATFGQVVGKLAELDVDPEISGILVLRPLPRHLPEARILRAIPPHKDVEAQHPENAGLLALGTPRFVPSTPAAAFVMLDSYMLDTGREIETAYDGLDLVVVGRSSNVGKPAAILGLARNATVISCHKHTDDAGRLAEHTLLGDILIIAVGSPGLSPVTWCAPERSSSTSASIRSPELMATCTWSVTSTSIARLRSRRRCRQCRAVSVRSRMRGSFTTRSWELSVLPAPAVKLTALISWRHWVGSRRRSLVATER